MPGAIFVAGYNLGLLTTGSNTIPADLTPVIDASNTVEGSQTTNTVEYDARDDDHRPRRVPGSGDESATDASASVNFAD